MCTSTSTSVWGVPLSLTSTLDMCMRMCMYGRNASASQSFFKSGCVHAYVHVRVRMCMCMCMWGKCSSASASAWVFVCGCVRATPCEYVYIARRQTLKPPAWPTITCSTPHTPSITGSSLTSLSLYSRGLERGKRGCGFGFILVRDDSRTFA